MIEQLIGKVFATRNIAHREHFKTTSYAQHMALNEFYEDVIEAVDALVECYQGMFGLVDKFEIEDSIPDDVIGHLREESDWIEVNRESIAGGSNAVANLVDGVTAVYLKAIYKLETLQ